MNNYAHKTKLEELIIIDHQIDKTISDIGRLSSYNQSTSANISKIKLEKMNFLHSLMDKKNKLLNRIEKHSKTTV